MDVDVEVVDVDVDVEVEDVDSEMVKVTGMVCGVLVAPVAVMVMAPEYVPAASPEMFAVAVNELEALPESVPEAGESESHASVVLTLQFKSPFPELETDTVCVGEMLSL